MKGDSKIQIFILAAVGLFLVSAVVLAFLNQSYLLEKELEGNLNKNSLSFPEKETETTNKIALMPKQLVYDVPFFSQAPLGNWDDVRQNYGCEEASLLMAVNWIRGKTLTPEEVVQAIIALTEFQDEMYGNHYDTSIADTHKILKDYFNFKNAFFKYDISLEDVKRELAQNSLVIIPINGTLVNNPYYTQPGRFQHQILVIGYDDETQELIAHDPGTKRGSFYRYPYSTIDKALIDYETGRNETLYEIRTAMLVIPFE